MSDVDWQTLFGFDRVTVVGLQPLDQFVSPVGRVDHVGVTRAFVTHDDGEEMAWPLYMLRHVDGVARSMAAHPSNDRKRTLRLLLGRHG